jgi:hypothetical protein
MNCRKAMDVPEPEPKRAHLEPPSEAEVLVLAAALRAEAEQRRLRVGETNFFPEELWPARMNLAAHWVRAWRMDLDTATVWARKSNELRRLLDDRYSSPIWANWFAQDFPEIVAATGGLRLPSWIRAQELAPDETRFHPWRRYYMWTMFFARRAYKDAARIQEDLTANQVRIWMQRAPLQQVTEQEENNLHEGLRVVGLEVIPEDVAEKEHISAAGRIYKRPFKLLDMDSKHWRNPTWLHAVPPSVALPHHGYAHVPLLVPAL